MTGSAPRTIASLLPSSTEILFALGLGERVVGVSHECDWPPEASQLPTLTETKIDADRPSGEIDRAIGDLAARGESVYRVRTDLLARLKPDLIITQDQCDVCAVTTLDVREAVDEVKRVDPAYDPGVLALTPSTLAEVLNDIRRVAEAAGEAAKGDRLLGELEARIDAIVSLTGEGVATRPRVTFLDWIDPLILAGDWIPEMIRAAGGKSQDAKDAKAARVSWDAVIDFSPEVLIVAPCGIRLERAMEETRSLAKLPNWLDLPAVKHGHVYAADGNALFNRPSHRIVDSLEVLAEIIHPNLFRGTVSDPEKLYRRLDQNSGG